MRGAKGQWDWKDVCMLIIRSVHIIQIGVVFVEVGNFKMCWTSAARIPQPTWITSCHVCFQNVWILDKLKKVFSWSQSRTKPLLSVACFSHGLSTHPMKPFWELHLLRQGATWQPKLGFSPGIHQDPQSLHFLNRFALWSVYSTNFTWASLFSQSCAGKKNTIPLFLFSDLMEEKFPWCKFLQEDGIWGWTAPGAGFWRLWKASMDSQIWALGRWVKAT